MGCFSSKAVQQEPTVEPTRGTQSVVNQHQHTVPETSLNQYNNEENQTSLKVAGAAGKLDSNAPEMSSPGVTKRKTKKTARIEPEWEIELPEVTATADSQNNSQLKTPNKAPLQSYYTSPQPKPPVSKFRLNRDERGLAIIRQEEFTKKIRELRARYTDPDEAQRAVDEFRRNWEASNEVKKEMKDQEVRLRPEVDTSPLAGPPNAEQRRQMMAVPREDDNPYTSFDTLRWD